MEIIKSKEKALEMQKEMCEAFIEYFGCNDPVFEDGKNAEKAINAFFGWRNTQWKVPGKDKTPNELWLEEHQQVFKMPKVRLKEMYDQEDVGIICDEEAGIGIFPDYGFVKELFKGDYRKINNFKDVVCGLVEHEDFMDSYILKKLILNNPKRSVEVFSAAYKNIKKIEDVLGLFKSRADWNKKPELKLIPVRT